MDEKTIVITEKSENQILGQESVFGWQMKQKTDAGKFLFFKYCQYTLIRDRNPEEVTQAHLDVEKRWDNEFSVWNNFILNGLKKFIIMEVVDLLVMWVGFVVMMVGIVTMDSSTSLPVSFIIGSVLVLLSLALSIPVLVLIQKNGMKRLTKMDEISRGMRQVNAIRNNK